MVELLVGIFALEFFHHLVAMPAWFGGARHLVRPNADKNEELKSEPDYGERYFVFPVYEILAPLLGTFISCSMKKLLEIARNDRYKISLLYIKYKWKISLTPREIYHNNSYLWERRDRGDGRR